MAKQAMTREPEGRGPHPGTADWVLLAALILIWGTAFLAIDVAVESLPPATLVAARVGIAAGVLCVAVLGRGLRLPRPGRVWIRFLLLAVVGNALPFYAISWGQQRVESGLAGILMAVMPLATLVLAHYFVAGEFMTRRRAAGFVIGLGGVFVLTGPSALAQIGGEASDLTRQAAVLAGALCYAVNTILARRMPQMHSLVLSACVMLMASAVMLPVAVLLDRPWTVSPLPASIGAAVWLGLVPTGVATVLYFLIVSRAGPTFLSLMNYVIPVVAMLTGIALAGESFEWRILGALALILTGLAISQMGSMRGIAARSGAL